jgi:hypothetical protein
MKTHRCVACGQALSSWVRADKLTCTGACRTRLCRMRKDARNTFVTGSRAAAPRSGAGWTNEPVEALGDVREPEGNLVQLAIWSTGRVAP